MTSKFPATYHVYPANGGFDMLDLAGSDRKDLIVIDAGDQINQSRGFLDFL